MKEPVSRIAKKPKLQPLGGFIPPRDMTVESLCEGCEDLHESIVTAGYHDGGLSPQIFGLVFDYCLRTELGIMDGAKANVSLFHAFFASIEGAKIAGDYKRANDLFKRLTELFSEERLDYRRIAQTAGKLVAYDAFFRGSRFDFSSTVIRASEENARALKTMLAEAKSYLTKKQKVYAIGFAFGADGAANVFPSDGDLITEDSVIDFKCSKNPPSSKDTFQLLLYYILGMHEFSDVFSKLKYVKILNPRLGNVYSYEISRIDTETLKHVESEIMGYKKSVFDVNKKGKK